MIGGDLMNREYCLARRVLKLANVIVKNRNRHVRELDLTTQQADAIQFFAGAEDRTCADLGKYLGITHQTASGIVKRLQAKNVVTVINSETDQRSNWVRLTDEGQRLLNRLVYNGTHTGEKLLRGMDEQDRESLFRLLEKAIENVTDGQE